MTLGARCASVAVGVVADRVLGEPPVHHPVAAFGRAMRAVEGRLYHDGRAPGAVHVGIGVGLAAATGATLRSTAGATYLATAGRALHDAAQAVDDALRAGDVDRARELLPALVGRDPASLDEKQVVRAVIESVAENSVDAIVAPALWGVLGGAPGVLVHRAVDTLDSMVGYRDERYARFGWASARLDDALAWLPARVTAALVIVARPASAAAVVRTVRGDAAAHPSPNAGIAEAAFAAALGIRLGGSNTYSGTIEHRPSLGDGRAPEPPDIARAIALSRDITTALVTGLGGVAVATGVLRRRRHRRAA